MTNTKTKRWTAIVGVVITSILGALSVLTTTKFPGSWEGPALSIVAILTALFTAIQNIWRAVAPTIAPLAVTQKRRYVRRKKDLPPPTSETKEDSK